MHRTNIYLEERQVAELDRRARLLGVSRAAALRAALDDVLDTTDERLEADLDAIREAFGAWKGRRSTPSRVDSRQEYLDRLMS